MLEIILFHMISPFLINPAYPDENEAYNSGVREVEKSYRSDKPATDYPIITLDILLHDSEYNYIQPGIYAVDIASDFKKLLFLNGNKIIAKSTIIQVIQLEEEETNIVPSAFIALKQKDKVFIIYKNKDFEIHSVLYKAANIKE